MLIMFTRYMIRVLFGTFSTGCPINWLNRANSERLDSPDQAHLDKPPAQRVQSAQFHRACSSVGRALQSHCRGQGFESPQVHLDAVSRCQSHNLTTAMMGSNKPSSQRAGNSASPAQRYPRRAHLVQLTPEPRQSAPQQLPTICARYAH